MIEKDLENLLNDIEQLDKSDLHDPNSLAGSKINKGKEKPKHPDDEEEKQVKQKGKNSIVSDLLKELEFIDNEQQQQQQMQQKGQKNARHNKKQSIIDLKKDEMETYQKHKDYLIDNSHKAHQRNQDENDKFDIDVLIKEIDENQTNEEKVYSKLIDILDKCNKAPQLPLLKIKAKKKLKSAAFVIEHLKFFDRQYQERINKLPDDYFLKGEAVSAFAPDKIYDDEEAQTMLPIQPKEKIIILAAFTADWLITRKDQDGDKFNCRLLPLNLIRISSESLPILKRQYEVKLWSGFGSLFSLNELKDAISKQNIFTETLDLDVLLKDSKASPKLIYQATRDFNLHEPVEFAADNIPLLKLRKGDFIVITKLPNAAGWSEGYALYKNDLSLGLFHSTFATLIKFKSNRSGFSENPFSNEFNEDLEENF